MVECTCLTTKTHTGNDLEKVSVDKPNVYFMNRKILLHNQVHFAPPQTTTKLKKLQKAVVYVLKKTTKATPSSVAEFL